MHNDSYWKSKIPLWMVLLFLINVFLIGTVELLAIYRYPADADEAVLARWEDSFSGCTILSRDDRNGLHCILVETAAGQTQLIVGKSHSVLPGRIRLLSAHPVSIPEAGKLETLDVRVGIHTATLSVTGSRVVVSFYQANTVKDASTFYMLAAALLEALELGLWYLVKGRFA